MASTDGSPTAVTTPLQILVVEDDERSGRMLADLLRHEGFAVEFRPGGLSGLERLAYEPTPDVLLLDLRMPQIDGITVARLARTQSPAMQIFILTAYPDLVRRLGASDPPARLFIKPIDYPALVEALHDVQRSKHA